MLENILKGLWLGCSSFLKVAGLISLTKKKNVFSKHVVKKTAY